VEGRKAGSRASRKSAAMVFLAVWAIFTVGSQTDLKRPSTAVGRVLTARMEVPPAPISIPSLYTPQWDNTIVDIPSHHAPPAGPNSHEAADHETSPHQRVIGRIFAWVCTTLYLTSRLPQIWKNVCSALVDIPAHLTQNLF
jgi:solute carrier family 66 (lysosomal lysine-arginine transporter), member 1